MYLKTTSLRWLGSLMMTAMLLFGTIQLMAQPSLTITPTVLDLGDRPIGASYNLDITAAALTAPDAAVYMAPADGATDIINGMDLEWTFGANTLEYQVILGTTYPPSNVVVDWTSAFPEVTSPLEGTWMVANEPGSIGVGPVQGSMAWWSVPAGDLIARACFFDDKYVFNADGSFQNVMDGLTFLEPWQGGSFNCGSPVAPHDGSADATYEYNESAGTITLNGIGAYMGLPKVYNGGELTNPNNAPPSITYIADLSEDGNNMILDISIGGGWWRFKMVKETSVPGTYTLANLQPNLQYFWQVNTRNSNATTINPEIWGFTTPFSPPAGLTGNAKVYEGEDVVLVWENPVDRAFLGYNVYRDGIRINTAMLTEATYTDAAPAYNIVGYDYNVTAIYDEGESGFSATFTAQVTGEGTLNGHVSDLNTVDEIADATVTMTGVDEFGEIQVYSTTTNANGNYTADVFAGTYNISVAADGYITAEETGIVVAYGATETTDFMLFEIAYPVAVVTASEFDGNILIEYSFDPAAGGRALVEFQIWRERLYLPGSIEMIGTTTQMQFVDFEWNVQDWGVYTWSVVAVYDLNQSDPVASNPIDQDMFTMVDVSVVLNSAESPAGTSVVFTNVDESPELTYIASLGADGMYTWDSFRKGTYDIEVSLPGYGTLTETGVDIFDEASFNWTLIETLATPASLYVTPTGLASWSSESPLEGVWMVANEPGSMGVGPVQGSMAWWSVPAGDLIARACFFDDKYIFNADGSFQNVMDGLTFLEPWQGGSFNCGSPVAPHDGSADATYEYNESAGTITLNGVGAYMGLPKVYNGGELTNPSNAPPSITYIADLSEDGNNMILDISIGGGWWRFIMVREGYEPRALETYKIFLDGILLGEQSGSEYQHGGFGETLVYGETYTTGVAAVFTTGQSATAEFTWKYVACDNYGTPAAFAAEQLIGTLNINLSWTNVDAAALDTISALRIYRNGQAYTELDFTAGSVSSYLDGNLAFGDYTYCLTYIYDSGAETCLDAVCSDAVTITGSGFVNGIVTAFDGEAAIAGATVTLSNDNNNFAFTTNAAGFYEGEVIQGTYNYLVEADTYESQTLEDVAIPFGGTVTNDFVLLEFPYAAADVVATELSENGVEIAWSANGGIPNGYSIYRTACETGDLQLLGFTLDEQFTDNTWGGVDAGVYKWGVVAEYDNNASEVTFSNCLDKDMITQVSVMVTTNSQDSPAGTLVLLTNTSEPDLGLVYETTLNATGYFIWDEFRKGTYDISVNKASFEPINLTGVLIEVAEDFEWLLEEQLLPVTDLFVNPNGLASWGGVGGPPSPLQGTWQVAAELGSMGVGPVQGDMSWWSVGEVDLEVRSCFWDDRYIFRANGTFDNEFDDLTFLEPWQGVNYECGTPVAPHDGSANATFDYDEDAGTVTINGVGAFLGVPKVYNGGELTNPNDAPASITYLAELSEDGNTMILDINFGPGWWRFKMVRAGTAARELQYYTVLLDGIVQGTTEEEFFQYDSENLTEGQEYLAEVAAVYTTGMSAKMEYVWTYLSCENFPGPDNLMAHVEGFDVELNWSGELPPPPPGEAFEEDFEGAFPPTGWAVLSPDGGTGWTDLASGTTPIPGWTGGEATAAPDGGAKMAFATWETGGAASNNQWLVTPQITVTDGDILAFYMRYWPTTYDDNVDIRISTTSQTDPAAFSIIVDELQFGAASSEDWELYEYDLTDFVLAGAQVYIGFREHVADNFNDGAAIFLDNVYVGAPTAFAAVTPGTSSSTGIERDLHISERLAEMAKRVVAETAEAATGTAVVPQGRKEQGISRALLHDNGPLVNSPGTGPGGADESILQNSSLGMTTLGGGIQFGIGNHMADDFVVDETWEVESFTFYGYQTGSSTTSSFTGGYLRIYDGAPNAGGTVVWGDLTTNRMTSAAWTNIYRISETTVNTDRPIMEIVCETPGLTLEPGTYWVEYTLDGSLASGPWAPPITINGELTTGNALQYITADGAWNQFLDGGSETSQGLPFLIEGSTSGSGGGGIPGYDFLGANVYRDGVLIAEMVQGDNFTDEGLEPGYYEYCVTFVYEDGAESCLGEACVFDVLVTEDCLAPFDLIATVVNEGEPGPQEIALVWNTFPGVWLSYGDGIYSDAIGLTDFSPITVAVEFTADMLSDYDGKAFSKVNMYYGTGSIGDMVVQIWEGSTLILEEEVTITIVGESWNEIELNEPVIIDGNKSYRIGYTLSNYDAFPAGAQDYTGDLNSDLVFLDGAWDNLSNYLPYSWLLEAYVSNATNRATDNYTMISSNAISATTGTPVSSPKPVDVSRAQVGKQVEAIRAFLGYKIYVSFNDGDYELLEAQWPETSYTYEVGTSGMYCYIVTADYEFCGESEPSNEACVSPVTGITEISAVAARLYPNPARDYITIEADGMNSITVINAIGQVVYELQVDNLQTKFNLSSFEAGIYIIRINTETGIVTKRLNIIR